MNNDESGVIDGAGEALDDVQDMGVGQRLQAARLHAGLSLPDVARETRIPERHLVAIENGDFARLPAKTYAVGFSRSYARLLGMDERAIGEAVRAELAASQTGPAEHPTRFEPGDPSRVPSRRLAWLGLAAIVLLLAGGYSFYRTYLAPGVSPAPLITRDAAGGQPAAPRGAPAAAAPAAAAVPTGGEVVFTATEDGVWARFYDGAGNRLVEKQFARGERFVVPATATRPQIWTGRPDALAITIGGRAVPPLAQDDMIMRDVPVDAASLLARPAPGAATATLPVDAATSAAAPAAVPPTAPAR